MPGLRHRIRLSEGRVGIGLRGNGGWIRLVFRKCEAGRKCSLSLPDDYPSGLNSSCRVKIEAALEFCVRWIDTSFIQGSGGELCECFKARSC